MIGMQGHSRFDAAKIRRAETQGTLRSLGHAAATVRLVAKRLFRRRKGPSAAGQPPHTQTKRLPKSIVYAVERQAGRAVIGPDYALIGTVGGAHEHGGLYRGQTFARRPFMGPALEKIEDRLPKHWEGSVR